MRTHGYTFIEILIVLVILAILAVIGALNLQRLGDVTRVRAQAGEIAAALGQARSEAQRYNQNVTFTLDTTTGASYTLTRGGTTRTFTLPAGIRFQSVGTVNTVVFQAPYGVVDQTGLAVRVRRVGVTLPTVVVNLTGLVGKVVTFNE